jgi:hypothetical protein
MDLDKKADSALLKWFYIRYCDIEIRLVLSSTDSCAVARSLCHREDWRDDRSGWQIANVGITNYNLEGESSGA